MKQYVSLSDNTILNSVALLEGFIEDQTKLTISRDALPTFTNVPTKEVVVEETAPIRGPLEEPTTPLVPHEEQRKVEAPQISSPVGGKCCTPPN